MSTTTFDEIERRTDRTFAYAILVRFASNYFMCVARLTGMCRALDCLLSVLAPEKLDALTPEQSQWLTQRLQELHRTLATFSGSAEAETIKSLPFLSAMIVRVQDATEDIGDIVENLVLCKDEEFRSLISDCALSIGLSGGETIAGMHR